MKPAAQQYISSSSAVSPYVTSSNDLLEQQLNTLTLN